MGRLSRDQPEKHHPADPALYRRLAGLGCEVRVMGGTCLAGDGDGSPAVRLLPAGARAPEDFLRGLDAFFYRTGPGCVEAFGRVVVEAMACGLPVVCARGGGYGEVVEDGRSGFLFDTDAEAEAILLRLRGDPALRRSVGRAARARVEALYSTDRRRAHADFYLR